MKTLLRRFYCDDTGVSAVEFALIAAFLLIPLLLGASELGYRTWAKHQFENAAQAGMDYAIVKQCADHACGQITAAAVQDAVHTATRVGPNVTVAPASGCGANYTCYGCPGASGVTFSATQTTCARGNRFRTFAQERWPCKPFSSGPAWHTCATSSCRRKSLRETIAK